MRPMDRKHICVVGIQWGDEGKGKIVDALTPQTDIIVRFQGGANAGHTVKTGDQEYVFHLIPSGILHDGKICVIGNGVVLDPKGLIEELEGLKAAGIDREENIWISDRAHVVLPYHRLLDRAKEMASKDRKIGTTLRGIGPCYTDKAARQGLRMLDLIDPDRLRRVLTRTLEQKNRELEQLYGAEPLVLEEVYEEYVRYGQRLKPRVRDITRALLEQHHAGAEIMFEGGQGFLLDVDLGTYPFVTSSNTSFLGVGPGTGFSPRHVGTVLGILKAYSTRVGEGPFPTELNDELGETLRRVGDEFGATTGRPRRCGWLDLVAVRYAVRAGDIDTLAITKLDVLDGFDTIEVATSYHRNGSGPLEAFPSDLDSEVRPQYEKLPGWGARTDECRSPEDLPQAALDYLQFIADRTSCPISMVSVGKERSAMVKFDPWLKPRTS